MTQEKVKSFMSKPTLIIRLWNYLSGAGRVSESASPAKPENPLQQEPPVKVANRCVVLESETPGRMIVAMYATDDTMAMSLDIQGVLVFRAMLNDWIVKHASEYAEKIH